MQEDKQKKQVHYVHETAVAAYKCEVSHITPSPPASGSFHLLKTCDRVTGLTVIMPQTIVKKHPANLHTLTLVTFDQLVKLLDNE